MILYFVPIFLLSLCSLAARVNYHNYKLYKFTPKNNVLQTLQKLEEHGNFDENGERRPVLDFFAEPNRDQPSAFVLVAPEFYTTFLDILDDHQVTNIKLIRSNIQADFVAEANSEIKQRRRRRRNVFMSSGPHELKMFDIFAFHPYAEVVNHLKAIANYKSEMATFYNISKTFEGRDLVGLKITSPNSNVEKPSMFIDAGIHSREWISIGVATYMVDRMVNEYGTDDKITFLLDNFDIFIVPMANPDGYVYSMTNDRLWRKTRSKNDLVNKWCRGADANRNWSFRWGQVGATRSPCSNTYAGYQAFSEPEVVGLKEFIANNVHNLKVYASLHAYGQLFLSPWGYTSERPNNYRDQQMAAKYAVDAIKNETGAVYTYGTIAEVMYPASGTSIDYMQSKGVPYVYGIELRPLEIDQAGFTIPSTQIEPTGREMLASFAKIGEYVLDKLPRQMILKRRRQ